MLSSLVKRFESVVVSVCLQSSSHACLQTRWHTLLSSLLDDVLPSLVHPLRPLIARLLSLEPADRSLGDFVSATSSTPAMSTKSPSSRGATKIDRSPSSAMLKRSSSSSASSSGAESLTAPTDPLNWSCDELLVRLASHRLPSSSSSPTSHSFHLCRQRSGCARCRSARIVCSLCSCASAPLTAPQCSRSPRPILLSLVKSECRFAVWR